MIDAFGRPQSAVVLGGTSDIALALLRRLCAATCTTVVLAGRHPERLAGAAEEIRRAGATTVATVAMEATDPDSADKVVAECFAAVGTEVDLVVLAVGTLGDQAVDERQGARAAEVVTVNFTWPAAALTAVAERLRPQGSGRIVVLSTVAGVRVRRANYVYGSAKAGLDGFAIGLAEALRGSGVRLQVVRPGFVHTKMTRGMKAQPLATTPEAVAEVVEGGLATGAMVLWAPAVLRWVFAVFKNLPQALWRRLPG